LVHMGIIGAYGHHWCIWAFVALEGAAYSPITICTAFISICGACASVAFHFLTLHAT
jgi:hypothetical protein